MDLLDSFSEDANESVAPDSSISANYNTIQLVLSPSTVSTPSRSSNRRTSLVWDYTSFNNRNQVVLNKDNKVIWCCRYCPQEYVESGGTAIIFSHLNKAHEIDPRTLQETVKSKAQGTIKAAFELAVQSGEHKRRRLDSQISTETLDPTVLERLYVQWLTRCGIPFVMVQRVEFRA